MRTAFTELIRLIFSLQNSWKSAKCANYRQSMSPSRCRPI